MDTKKEMIKLINKIANRYGTYEVFFDFVQLASLAITNIDEDDKSLFDKREKQYLDVIGRYKKEEYDIFPELLALLAMELNFYPSDILGEIFHDLELQNEWKGQYFTSIYICEAMSEMSLPNLEQVIEEQGYITVDEPACGSGAMLIGMARSMKRRGYDCAQILARATDVDVRCVYMTYLQLSLLGIPAVVIHGNSLTFETYSIWETPMYKRARKLQEKTRKEDDESA